MKTTINTAVAAHMQFEKRNFMGIELDVLTGHPEHDLLFVATQVARAAGLKNASHATWKITSGMPSQALQIGSLPKTETLKTPSNVQKTSWLTSEEAVYQMLLRGHAPASEPFRKWVTEEVLPTIRKTGKYNAEDSTNPIAQSLMDELKTLRTEVGSLRGLIETFISQAQPGISSPSSTPKSAYLCPDVHTEFVWRHFDRKLLLKLCEMRNLSAPVADKLKGAVMLNLEVAMLALWNLTDPRKLVTEQSQGNKRPWARFPLDFLKKQMNQDAYGAALDKALNEYLSK